MKRINNYSNKIYNLLGFQEVTEEQQYTPIKYCITKESDKGILIYNTLTHELLLLDDDEYYNLYLDNKYGLCEEYQYLIRHWFLIPQNRNANDLCYAFKQIYVNTHRKKEIDKLSRYTILTTTNCNARCNYCYESECNKRDMGVDTATDVADYIVKHSSGKIFLQWFGGEPLCNAKVIDSICKYLKRCKVEYSSGMVTNGYLLSEYDINIIKKLWKLEKVQITLDGTENEYGKIKNYINHDENAFEKVLNNIETLLCNEIAVNIRLNISLNNIDDMHTLIELLYNKFRLYQNKLHIYSHPLFEEEGSYLSGLTESERKYLYEGYTSIQNHIRKTGMGRWHSLRPRISNHCMADNRNSVVITPEGNITLCEHHIDDEFIGNIYDDTLNKTKIQQWSKHYNISDCSECVLYPQCTKIQKCPVSKCSKEYQEYVIVEIQETMLEMLKKMKENIFS